MLRNGRLTALGLLLCLGLVAPARAGVVDLGRDLERLGAEVRALRGVIPVQAGDAGRLARFEIRLERLEEEVRRLTGRIERLEFGERRLNERFEQLIGDLDERLRGLEGDETALGADAGGLPQPPDTPLSQSGAAAGVLPPEPAPREGELGTVPESALAGLPRPDPGAATPPPRSALPAEEQYEQAMNLLRAGDYGAAEQGLDLFVDIHADHPLAANASYWLAETHYVRRNFAAAAAEFARNYRTYGRDAPKAMDNLLKLGMSLQGLGENEKACLTYDELAQEFPNPPAHIRQALDRERARAECV